MSKQLPDQEQIVRVPGYKPIVVPQFEMVKAIADLQARVAALEEFEARRQAIAEERYADLLLLAQSAGAPHGA